MGSPSSPRPITTAEATPSLLPASLRRFGPLGRCAARLYTSARNPRRRATHAYHHGRHRPRPRRGDRGGLHQRRRDARPHHGPVDRHVGGPPSRRGGPAEAPSQVDRRLHAGHDGHEDRRHPHDRRRQPGLPAVLPAVRSRHRSVGARRPDEPPRLRGPRRLDDRPQPRLRRRHRHLDPGGVQQRDPARAQGLRHLPVPGQLQRGAGPGGRPVRRLLRRRPGGRRRSRTPTSRRSTTIAGLKDFQFGAQVGTTSLETINTIIAPTKEAKIYDTNDLAIEALKNGQIDGLVVDFPTAFYVANVQSTDGVIVGQFPAPEGGEHFSVVLDKDSTLTECVNTAIGQLRDSGELAPDHRPRSSRQRRRPGLPALTVRAL